MAGALGGNLLNCDCVLVPRGYHRVSAAPGFDLYYLNVMAGPVRQWRVTLDADVERALQDL